MSEASVKKATLRDVLREPRMVAVLMMGAASGLPYNLTDSTLQAWLKDSGLTNTAIGVLTLVGIPYTWKFLWAPLLDRYPLPFLGRRRGWIFVAQLALAAVIGAMAFLNPSTALMTIAYLTFAVAFLSATQDIAINAWTTDLSRPHERGLASTATALGWRSASWFSFAVALVMAELWGWSAAYLVLAGLMVLLAIGTLFSPEDHSVREPTTLAEAVWIPLKQLLASPGMIGMVVMLVVYKFGDAFALKLFTPFLMDVGFSKLEIASVAKSVMLGATIAGTLVGGLFMIRLGLYRSLLWFGVAQGIANLTYMVLALAGKSFPLMVAAVAVDNFAGGMGSVAGGALVMALCDKRFSAFQFALLSSLAMFPRTYLGPPAGWLADQAGWSTFYLVSFIVALPGIFLVWVYRERLRAFG